jgi:ferredoxin
MDFRDAMDMAWEEVDERDQDMVSECGCGGACGPCSVVMESVRERASDIMDEAIADTEGCRHGHR